MKVLETQEIELKAKMGSISNQKEYKSFHKELSVLHEKRLYHEQELLVLWNKYDLLKKGYESKIQSHEKSVNSVKQEILVCDQQINELKVELEIILAERVLKEKLVPQEWLDMYSNMKGRVSNPVVPIVGDACDACF